MPGNDGITPQHFAADAPQRLALLASDLARGRYRPGAVRRFTIPKNHGPGDRTLGLLCMADRIAQSATVLLLTPIAERIFVDDSYGYRRGRSVNSAARRISALYHQGYHHVIEADIVSYFDNVPHAPLLDRLATLVPDRRFAALMALWLDQSGMPDKGLVQGAPISPLLANLYLDRIDHDVAADGVRLVRFADDFVILTKSRAIAEQQLVAVSAKLAAMGLQLHPGKTRISDFDHGFDFLGRRFLKSFIFDDPDGLDPDDWDAAIAAAVPATAPGSQQFRNRDLGETEALPVALPIDDARSATLALPPAGLVGGAQDPDDAAVEMPGAALSPRVRTLHLHGKGRRLDCRDNAFSVCEDGNEIWLRAASAIDRIDIGPNARFSDAALRFALATDTPVYFIDGRGTTQGMLGDAVGRSARTQLAQARHAIDPALRLALARQFVAGKIINQRSVLQRWANNDRGDDDAAAATARAVSIAQLDRLHAAIPKADAHGSLLGLEGSATKIFLRGFDAALIDWSLDRRLRRPQPDPVNALLNWLAALLMRDLQVLIARHGLHPGFALLHASEDGRDSLAFDLAEEFRAPVCEALALTLFNTKQLTAAHFFAAPDDDHRCWMTPEAVRHTIKRYEEWVTRPGLRPPPGSHMVRPSWRAVFEHQVVLLRRHFEASASYVPYRIKA